MTWTNEYPTVPGWYWFREYGRARVTHVFYHGGVLCQSGNYSILLNKPGQHDWAGPIEKPEEKSS